MIEKQKGCLAITMAITALVLTVWTGSARAQTETIPVAKHYTFGMLLSTLNNPYFVSIKKAAQSEAKNLGVSLLIEDANNSSATQTNQINTLLARKVDALLVNPTNAKSLIPAIRKANAAHVPVVFIDRKTDGGKAIAYFASDNVAAGALACKYIVNRLHGKGNVAILLGIPGASATNERSVGCDRVFARNKGIKIVARQTAKFSRQDGLTVMRDILIAHPTLNAVYAENGQMAIGAMHAIEAAGKQKDVFITMIGSGSAEQTDLIREGHIALSVAQQPGVMAAMGVEAAYNKLASGMLFVPVPLKIDQAPKAR
ncbi:substrate-binding domain-containing protein [Acidiphilium sp.]|uniref:substrate-binding domain-containing protein n=1 Tax=Acidiphilium sp. TaxID=527 RepID=UPI003D0186CE